MSEVDNICLRGLKTKRFEWYYLIHNGVLSLINKGIGDIYFKSAKYRRKMDLFLTQRDKIGLGKGMKITGIKIRFIF
jgi:hypothetical protein